MKLDSKILTEAQMAARAPRFKYLVLGLVCGAVVPSIYARRYSDMLKTKDSLKDINSIKEQAKYIQEHSVMLGSGVETTNLKADDTTFSPRSMNAGQKFSNDDCYKKIADENSMIMFSSIL